MDQDNAGTLNPIAPAGASNTNENTNETANENTGQNTFKTTETITETTVETVTSPPQSPAPSQPTANQSKKNKGFIATIIILAILALAGLAFGIYGMFLKPEPKCETVDNPTSDNNSTTQPQTPVEEQETYQLSDYVSFSEVSIPVTFPDEVEKGHTEDIIKKIDLKNLPIQTINRFNTAQEEMINYNNYYIISRENKADASINGDILSAFNVIKNSEVFGTTGQAETFNYNLETQKELSNKELANSYSLTIEEIYTEILQHLANNNEVDSFLLSTTGDVTAPTISLADFKNKISEYAKTLSSNLELFKLYLDVNDTVHALYQQKDILEALGMGTHMGIGLHGEMQDVVVH